MCSAELRRSGDITSRMVALREKVVTLGRKYAASEHYFPLGKIDVCFRYCDPKISCPRIPFLCFLCLLVYHLYTDVHASCRPNKLVSDALFDQKTWSFRTCSDLIIECDLRKNITCIVSWLNKMLLW